MYTFKINQGIFSMPRKKQFDHNLHINAIKEDVEHAAIYADNKKTTLSQLIRDYIKRLANKVTK